MIRYALRCAHGHGFEGWFSSSTDYDRQLERSLIECPICGSCEIEKAIMAPSISRSQRKSGKQPPESEVETQPATTGDQKPAMPAAEMQQAMAASVRTMHLLKAIHQHVKDNFENVGQNFAQEARDIHHGEKDPKDIVGEATLQEAKELMEEGIDVFMLPEIQKMNG